ncbi:MAG TPA: hypothetical protein IAA98_06490 [Candidatus Avipropionibacterium avicola]|uniref:Uncharacterized protein n=1 Tax=Candidatus Avipropionibacterium avicola TaxID=2840701 RepID=A0A9D1KND8_9ACTN|nr:hypothetical protein [Candidatus Avipropionibacterium avicola]
MDLETATAELYGLAPEEFVARRTALVRQARTAKDRALAQRIQALARPTRSAWLVNLVARHQPEVLAELFELAELLAEGMRTVSGPELQQLTRQRNTVVAGLTRTAIGLGHQQGHRASESTRQEINDTFTAALADPDTAELVRSGTLTRAVRWSGFGLPGVDARTATPPEPNDTDQDTGRDTGQDSDEDDTGGAEVVDLEPRRRAADRERLRVELERSRSRWASASTRHQRLTDQLAELTDRVERAAELVRTAQEQASDAQREARAAQDRVRECERALEAARSACTALVATAERADHELSESVGRLRRERDRDASVREQLGEAEQALAAAERDVDRAESAWEEK